MSEAKNIESKMNGGADWQAASTGTWSAPDRAANLPPFAVGNAAAAAAAAADDDENEVAAQFN